MISARKAKHLDATAMFTYSHANTPLSQSERAYYLSYFINCFEENNNKQPAHETQTDIENHAFCAQPSNKSIISKQITYEPLVTVTINIVLQTLVTVFLNGVFVGEIHESKNNFVFLR